VSAHIAISSGSSWRRSRLYWFCMDTNGVQPPTSAARCSLANCQPNIDDARPSCIRPNTLVASTMSSRATNSAQITVVPPSATSSIPFT
jgi:hypothetical protein